MKTDYEIVMRMRQLEKMRPSIYGNSIVMLLLQFITFALAIFLIGMFIMKKVDPTTAPFIIEWLGGIDPAMNEPELADCREHLIKQQETVMSNVLSNLYLATGLLMAFINRLTVMVGRRNVFLMQFVEILDKDEKR